MAPLNSSKKIIGSYNNIFSSNPHNILINHSNINNNTLIQSNNKNQKKQFKLNSPLQTFKYYVGNGNNPSLIRRIMSTRKQWQQITDSKYLFLNFKWQQTSNNIKFQNCVDNKIFKQSVNHLQFHQQLSNKEYLFKNLTQYCQSQKINVFSIVPLTFVLNFVDSGNIQQNQAHFLKIYSTNLPQQMKTIGRKQSLNLRKRKSIGIGKNTIDTYFHHTNIKNKQCTKYQLNDMFKQSINSKYLWILKPTFRNRGNGIHVFNNLTDLQNLMNGYMSGENNILSSRSPTRNQISSPQPKNKSFRIRDYTNEQSKTVNSFVVQKYLQRPLLYQGRKFDIRVWVLFSYQMKVYLFKQGYMRTSSYKYSTGQSQINDLNVHLTNNAVQKNNQQYGKYQDGNQLSFKVLKQLIQRNGNSFTQVMNKIKNIIKITALSVKKKINKNQRSFCMQIFGYDFMFDQNCNPWLIEVNTNPCIEQSSVLLETLLPRMLDDAFCLTIDRIFDTQKKGYNYTIENQYNTDNLWQLIVDLKKQPLKNTQLLTQHSSQVIEDNSLIII